METFVYISICLKLGQGGLSTLGSYNEFHSNLFLNLLVVIFSSFLCPIMVAFCLTPLYSAFVARLTDEPVDYEFFMDALVNFQEYEGVSVTASSLMLFQTMCGAFIIFFAIGILFLSLGNQMMRITLLMSSMREHFHIFVDTFHRNTMVSLLCVFGCLLNFLFYTMYGVLFYTFLASVFLPLVCSATGMLEVLTVAYVYGSKKMFTNISAMLFGFSQKSRRRGFWRMVPYFNGYMMYCWRYITPLVILTFMIHWIWKLDESHVNIQIAFFGVLIAYSVIAYVPVDCIIRIGMAIYQKEPYLVLFKPHLLLFGPRKQKDRRLAQTQEERWRI